MMSRSQFTKSSFMQWLLSASLLVGAFMCGRKAQTDIRLLPVAIILLLFAVPIPILASFFPGEDQLREFTSIKYGPPIAAFVDLLEQELPKSSSSKESGLKQLNLSEEAWVEPQANESLSTKASAQPAPLEEVGTSGSGSVIPSNKDQDKTENDATSTIVIVKEPVQFCAERFNLGKWNLSRVEERTSAHFSTGGIGDKNFDSSGWGALWEPDPVSVHPCNFTERSRFESLALPDSLSGATSVQINRTSSADLKLKGADGKGFDSPMLRAQVMGDSQGRLFALALLRLLRGIQKDELDLFQQKHSDWNVTIMANGLSLEFWWAPFTTNATDRLQALSAVEVPDLLVMSFGLWHMLYTNDSEDYGRGLRELQATLQETYRIPGRRGPLLFWLNNPFLVSEKLNTEAKRTRMTEDRLRAYNEKVAKRGLLMPEGDAFLIDLFELTQSCGDSCAADGMHYMPEVYDVAVQIMLNIAAATVI